MARDDGDPDALDTLLRRMSECKEQEKRNVLVSRCLRRAIDRARGSLQRAPDRVLVDESKHAQAVRKVWFLEYTVLNRRVWKLSLADLAWVTWAHLVVASRLELRKPVTNEDAINTHAFVRMVLQEFNDFRKDWQKLMDPLEERCARVAVFTPDSTTTTNIQHIPSRPLYAASTASAASSSSSSAFIDDGQFDWEREEDDDFADDMALIKAKAAQLRNAQKAAATASGASSKNTTTQHGDLQVQSGSSSAISELGGQKEDRVTTYVNHLVAQNRGNFRLYIPERYKISDFTADCSRLFYWNTVINVFLAEHVIRPAKDTVLKDYAAACQGVWEAVIAQAKVMTSSAITSRATELMYQLRLPVGAQLAYHRANGVPVGVTSSYNIMRFDCGDEYTMAITDLINRDVQEVLIESEATRRNRAQKKPVAEPDWNWESASSMLQGVLSPDAHPMKEVWTWIMWHRLFVPHGIDFLAKFLLCHDDIPIRSKTLHDTMIWVQHTRRPLIVRIGSAYYVQAVLQDAPDEAHNRDKTHELFECTSYVEAMATWAVLMRERHNDKLIDGLEVGDVTKCVLALHEVDDGDTLMTAVAEDPSLSNM